MFVACPVERRSIGHSIPAAKTVKMLEELFIRCEGIMITKAKKGKKALLLGAGGPLGGLEAGALIALDEKGVKFDVISGACIGSILTLAYASPAGGRTPREALEFWIGETGVSDVLYKSLPFDFKVFQKQAGALNPLADEWLKKMLSLNPLYSYEPVNAMHRLYSEMYLLSLVSMMPSTAPFDVSLSRIAPVLEVLIDFDNLKNAPHDIYINAMDVTEKEIVIFDKHQITPKHVLAGSSLFYICPQMEIDGKYYAEGSYIDSLNFKGILAKHDEIETIVVMNILNRKDLMRPAKNLVDSLNLSIMLPFITIAEDDLKLFEAKHKGKRNLLKAQFDIPKEHIPHAMDWSVSNFKRLRDIGYEAGLKLYAENKALLS
ncbi:MAG: patatin-like phospholipase [Proteobacteria bacterium]|nr:patatin-like phospholipase [Pseudomonadota bacterium]